jgi:hypothetical protein
MDQTLASLFPLNQIGSDGFNWWIGQVETKRNGDPKKAGRYKVRIVGQHLKNCDAMPTKDLPWASTMMPVTTPRSSSNSTGASVNLDQGDWVIGFYLDNDKQKPIIMGSVGHVPGSTTIMNEDPNPSGTCKSFTRYASEINPATDLPQKESKGKASADNGPGYEEGTNILGGDPIASSRAGEEGGWPPALMAAFGENSETNPTGGKLCVVVANPNCGTEKNLKSSLTHIIGDMLRANQQSGGQLGDFYVSKATGYLQDQISVGRYHINRAVRLIRSLMARAKGEIISLMKEATTKLINATLYTKDTSIIPDDINKPLTTEEKNALEGAKEVLAIAEANGDTASAKAALEEYDRVVKQINESRGHPGVKKRKSRIKGIQTWLDNILKELGCKMEDLTDRLAQWLTNLLLGYIQNAFSAATCLVDQLVNGILNQILGYIDTLINDILGGVEMLLSVIASPLNILGTALKKIMDLLGISCSGSAQCEKIQITCTDCATSGDNEDDLDKLIKTIEDGNLDYSSGICNDAKKYPSQLPTDIIFVGGVYEPPDNPNTLPDNTDNIATDEDRFNGTTFGSINYSSSDIEVYEGETAVFTIKRSGSIDVASSLRYKINEGNTNIGATLNLDYEPLETSGIIAFAPGESSKTLEFNTFIDNLIEGNEIFEVELNEASTPDGHYVVFETTNYLRCTIKDNIEDNIENNVVDAENPPIINTPNISLTEISGSSSPNSPIIELPTYNVTSNKEQVLEGDSVVFNIITTNVSDGTVLNYTLSGINITNSDIVGGSLTGSFVISSNSSTVTIQIATNNDGNTDDESLTFSIDDTNASKTVVISQTISTSPTYNVNADKVSVNEGETIVYTITTTNVSDGTILNYTLSGENITQSDIFGGVLSGTVTITSNQAKVSVQINQDNIIEIYSKILKFSLVDTNVYVNVVINADQVFPEQNVVNVLDKRYSISTDKLSYKEGETIIYTITTENVSDDTILTYRLYGANITSSDFILNSLYGQFVIKNNQAIVQIGIEEDTAIENNETVTFSIDKTNAFADVIIEGTFADKDKKPVEPCLKSPIATALTDEDGKIISIKIDDKGCPYVVKPEVIITGDGYGAAAIPLLDDKGYVSEIRITRTGLNYKKNVPTNLNCIIDSFTMIRPGQNYTSEPTVYINGDPTIATAIIEDGFVKGINILDRTVKYNKLPSVVIMGGGGMGAKFLASLSCLDSKDLEAKGYAKIGTGKYIDCP